MPTDPKRILHKLLWQGKSKWLLGGAVLGAFAGMWLLLAAAQFYFDVRQLMRGDANPSDQFVQINKKVSLLNTLGAKATFSPEEIAGIKAQQFVRDLGVFTASGFRVGAHSDMLGFYTELFFESVPDAFLDVDEPKFRWSEGQDEVPILVSKDYLALYNFGFAPSQGLPQVTPSTVRRLAMEVRVSGGGRQAEFKGRVVGFSDRINSILVPPAFMEWANRNFGGGGGNPLEGAGGGASRLILKVDNPLSKDFQSFLSEHGYETSAGRLIGGQFGVLLRILLGVVAGLGGLILGLSVLVFLLNFQLLVAQGAEDIRLLLQIGYPPRRVSGILVWRFALMFLLVAAAVFAALLGLRFWLVQYFENQGFALGAGLHGWVWALGAGFSLLLLAVNIANIRRSVAKLS